MDKELIKNRIRSAYEEMAESYNNLIDHKPHNAYYDRPNTLSLFPSNIEGKVVLDAACGPGKYAEILLARGAVVKGFDISPKMVDLAIHRNKGKGDFYVHDLSAPFDKLTSDSCDFVLCALALHYLEHWDLTMQEFYRVLKPGGLLIISLEHPFYDYTYFEAEHYFEIEHVNCTWKGFGTPIEVNSFRRPLGACISPLTDNGFVIDKILEPKPTKDFEKLDPRRYQELNEFPAFMCVRAVKLNRTA